MEFTAAEAWSQILERVRPQLQEQTYQTWLAKTEPLALTQHQLAVGASSEFAVEWIEHRYGKLLTEAAAQVLGHAIAISFQHHPNGAPDGSAQGRMLDAVTDHPAPGAPPAPAVPQAVPVNVPGSQLNERYTFERFVVGTNNQLAAAAAHAVSEAPARMYNPLFIYGGVGLGKTHLMHAIGHAVLARDPAKRVAYVSSERFTNEMVGAIQDGRMQEFRRRYREIDLLLIDDIHFLREKERTQEEFFHTFNALHDAQRQIVLTSDRPPKEINGLEERLVSRFEWGLVTDIKAPDLETREAILRKKADDDRLVLPDEVLQFVARNCRSNVRELEGALIKMLAYSSLTHREITVDLARDALGGGLAVAGSTEVTAAMIRMTVATRFSVTDDGLISPKRTKELTRARQVAMYLIRVELDLPLVEIGKLFGGRDHSTVIHSLQKVEEEMRNDEEFRQRVEAIRQSLRSPG